MCTPGQRGDTQDEPPKSTKTSAEEARGRDGAGRKESQRGGEKRRDYDRALRREDRKRGGGGGGDQKRVVRKEGAGGQRRENARGAEGEEVLPESS